MKSNENNNNKILPGKHVHNLYVQKYRISERKLFKCSLYTEL